MTDDVLRDTFTFSGQKTPLSRLDEIATSICERWNVRGDLPDAFRPVIREGVEELDAIAYDFLNTLSKIETTTDIHITKGTSNRRAKPENVAAAIKQYAEDPTASEHLIALVKIEHDKIDATLDLIDRFKNIIEKHGEPYNSEYPVNIPMFLAGSIIRGVIDNTEKTHDITIGYPRKELNAPDYM